MLYVALRVETGDTYGDVNFHYLSEFPLQISTWAFLQPLQQGWRLPENLFQHHHPGNDEQYKIINKSLR